MSAYWWTTLLFPGLRVVSVPIPSWSSLHIFIFASWRSYSGVECETNSSSSFIRPFFFTLWLNLGLFRLLRSVIDVTHFRQTMRWQLAVTRTFVSEHHSDSKWNFTWSLITKSTKETATNKTLFFSRMYILCDLDCLWIISYCVFFSVYCLYFSSLLLNSEKKTSKHQQVWSLISIVCTSHPRNILLK